MRSSVLCIAMVLAGLTASRAASTSGAFALELRKVEALEGGPVIAWLSLSYRGKAEVEVKCSSEWPAIGMRVSGPKNWSTAVPRGQVPLSGHLGIIGTKTLKPGDDFSIVSYVHHKFARIPAGKGEVTFALYIVPVMGKPLTVLQSAVVDVLPATAERVREKAEQLRETLNGKELSWDEKRHIVNTVIETEHTEFIPLCFELLKSQPRGTPDYGLRSFIYKRSRVANDVHARLIDHLRWFGAKADSQFFDLWRRDRVDLPSREVIELARSSDLWIRALSYAAFPKKCPRGTRNSLLAELSRIQDIVHGASKQPSRTQ